MTTSTHVATQELWTRLESIVRAIEAEDTLRAISAGEIDAFVVSDGSPERVVAVSTADGPYRQFVENMRDGAATLSSDGAILYANRRLVEMLASTRKAIVGCSLSRFVAGGLPIALGEYVGGAGGARDAVELDLIDVNGGLTPVLVGFSRLEVDGDRLTCLMFADLTLQRSQEREIARLDQAHAQQTAELRKAQAALAKQATHDGT
jgi:PAS domain S-box-containing protein